MATKAKVKFTKTEPKVAAKTTVVPRARRAVASDVVAARAIAGTKAVDDDAQPGPMVLVDVPHNFRLTDDTFIVHPYAAGRQKMPQEHAEHFYAKSHGVTIVEE